MLALVRASAWLAFVPPFSSSAIPKVVRLGLAAALALAAVSQLQPCPGTGGQRQPRSARAGFISDLVLQAVTGCVLGFITSLLLSVLSAAGSLTDMTSGLAAATIFDPISGTQNPVTANIYNVIMTTLLFATGGDLLIVKGFMTSFRSIGLSAKSVSLLGPTLLSETGFFFLAAVEIAAPVLGAMFLAYVTFGLLTRSAPQLNVMSLGFAINIALALVVVGACLAMLPGALIDPGRPGRHRHPGPARPQPLSRPGQAQHRCLTKTSTPGQRNRPPGARRSAPRRPGGPHARSRHVAGHNVGQLPRAAHGKDHLRLRRPPLVPGRRRHKPPEPGHRHVHSGEGGKGVLSNLAPAVLATMVLALVANLAQTRGLVTFKPLKPSFSHLNPAKGLKRLFSPARRGRRPSKQYGSAC